MAREHARLWLDINSDDDFAALSFDAQAFYTRIVLTEATLNYCGVADWRPRRLTVRARDLTLARITAAAAELEAGNYLLFDLDTEEVLARSFIRRDELLRNPKMAATVLKAYAAVASPVLRAAIVTEVKRVHAEHPEYSSWSHKDTADGLARLMSRPALAEGEYTPQITNPDPVPITNGQAVRITNPDPVTNTNPDPVENSDPHPGPDHQSQSVRNPSTSTLHPSPAPIGGYVTGERHQAAEPDSNGPRPPDRCPKHTRCADPPSCGPCGDARRSAEAWDRAQLQAAKAHQQAFLDEIAACPDCDEHGWVVVADEGNPEVVRCRRHDWNRREAAHA